MAGNKKEPGFNLTVHQRDVKGKIIKVDPYRLTIVEGEQRFERPPGSGKFYYANGKEVPKPTGQNKGA